MYNQEEERKWYQEQLDNLSQYEKFLCTKEEELEEELQNIHSLLKYVVRARQNELSQDMWMSGLKEKLNGPQ